MHLLRSEPRQAAQDPRARAGGAPAHGDGAEDFDAIFRSCVRDVHSYAFALLRDRAGAEEVTAIAFERLYRARGKLDGRRGTARGLLFTIARNAALDELRRRSRRPGADSEASESADARSQEELEQVERRALLAGALAALGPRERELVLLKFHGQLSNGELGRALGISETNAATRLHRALTRLRSACSAAEREQVA
jgi:RNA polymerase sigma-70 factor, ECF subfamily